MAQSGTTVARRGRAGLRRGPIWIRWATAAVLVAIWQLVASAFYSGSSFVASPWGTVVRGWRVFEKPDVRDSLVYTGVEFVIAFAGAVVIGVAFGLALGSLPKARRPAANLVQLLFAVPQVAVYPIFMLLFGLGAESKIVFGFTHAIFPIVLATLAGYEHVPESLPRAVRAMGGGRIAVAFRAVLPSMVPDVLTGVRLAAALALVGVLLGELMASQKGFGTELTLLIGSLNPDGVFALVCTAAIFAIGINWLLSVLREMTRKKFE